MTWIVYREYPCSEIKAVDVDKSMTPDEVDALLGTKLWVVVDATSAEEAIDSAIAGGFTKPAKLEKKFSGDGLITVGQILEGVKLLRKIYGHDDSSQ